MEVLGSAKNSKAMSVIKKSGISNYVVKLKYIDSKGTITERMIEPYEIKEGKLYGYSIKDDGIRSFKIESVLDATKTESKFVPRWPIKL
jgi:predicted DNA-binding transcriptional regulator YafY